ncbi:MAG: HAD-IA family hydrolase [Chloroflexota bacterium]
MTATMPGDVDAGPPFDAVIFDLDGVLVDSEIWWDEVRRSFAADHGRSWTMLDRAAVMGANSRQWSATMRERLNLELTDAAIERAIVDGVVGRFASAGAPAIAGAVETVRRIAGRWPVAVASSAHREVIDAALATTGLTDVFRIVVSSDEVDRGKPSPDVYLEAARRLGVAPGRCLVVEDSLNGVSAAVAAGMTVVLVPNRSVPPADGTAELAALVLDDIGRLDPSAIAATSRRPSMAEAPRDALPLSEIPAWRRTVRYWVSRVVVGVLARGYVRLRVEGMDRLPGGPAVYCFNHLNWTDPFMLMATLPMRPRLFFFGPKEEDMDLGGRNRIMRWTGTALPYKPGKNDLLGATRRVDAVLRSGAVIGIAGEGRIHHRESALLPLNEGTAYFAIRSGVPIVPIAINGTSWLRLGRIVRIRVGEPIHTAGRPTREAIADATERTSRALRDLVADAPDLPRPGPLGRWVTERFNEWPEGARPDDR